MDGAGLDHEIQAFDFQKAGVCAVLTAILTGSAPCHATLFALLCDNTQIVIASDSRRITIEHGQMTGRNGVEKVVALGPRLVFMSDGMSEITTTRSAISPTQVAKTIVASATSAGRRLNMEEVASLYGEALTKSFNSISGQAKTQVQTSITSLGNGGGQVLESIFAGRDSDGKLKIEMVDVLLQVNSASGDLRFVWTRSERVPTETMGMILSGDVKVLQAGFESSSSPIGQLPSFQAWVASGPRTTTSQQSPKRRSACKSVIEVQRSK